MNYKILFWNKLKFCWQFLFSKSINIHLKPMEAMYIPEQDVYKIFIEFDFLGQKFETSQTYTECYLRKILSEIQRRH